jgi:hypothetical protein
VAEVQPLAPDFAAGAPDVQGIRFVEQLRPRSSAVDPAVFLTTYFGAPYEWQYQATHANTVPASVLRAAPALTIAIVDSGADRAAPDIAAKKPHCAAARARYVFTLTALDTTAASSTFTING